MKRAPGTSDGLTREQAEAELRRRMAEELVGVGPECRRTVEEAGAAYVEHLEHVMGRKRTTLEDYRGYLGRHLGPFFGARRLDRVRPTEVERYLREKVAAGLALTTVVHHLTFLGGLFRFAVKRGWTDSNPVAFVDRPCCRASAAAGCASSSPKRSKRCCAPCPRTGSAGSSAGSTSVPR